MHNNNQKQNQQKADDQFEQTDHEEPKPEDFPEKLGEEKEAREENQNNAEVNLNPQAQVNEPTHGIDKNTDAWKYREYATNHYILFHGFMVLNSIYICSIFTNWGYAKISDNATWNYNGIDSKLAMIMKYVNVSLFSL